MVLVADRNFCTSRILFGIVQRSAFFVIRQHGSNLSWEREGKGRRIGRTATGMMFEQTLDLNYEGQTLPVRRLTIELDGPTNQGESEVHILTNLRLKQSRPARWWRRTACGGRSKRRSSV